MDTWGFLGRVKQGGVIDGASEEPLGIGNARRWLKLARGVNPDTYHTSHVIAVLCEHNQKMLSALTEGVSDSMAWGIDTARHFDIAEYGYPARFVLDFFRDVPLAECDEFGIALVLGNYAEAAGFIAQEQNKKLLHALISIRTPDTIIPDFYRDYSWFTWGIPM